MTSISGISASFRQSPLQRLQDELTSQVKSGSIAETDKSALSLALEDIDTAIQSSRSSDQSGGARGAPGDMKSKIESLIANEVSSGKLTSDQAEELKGVFEAAFTGGPGGLGGPGGPGGAGGAGGAGGPPPGPPPDESSSTSGSSSSSSTSSADDLLKQFLELLKDQLSSASTYGASGSGSGSTSFTALLLDIKS